MQSRTPNRFVFSVISASLWPNMLPLNAIPALFISCSPQDTSGQRETLPKCAVHINTTSRTPSLCVSTNSTRLWTLSVQYRYY
jgi:hypothetical protein